MPTTSLAVFLLPTPFRQLRNGALSRLEPTLASAAEVYYIDAGRGRPASLPAFVKVFRHPEGLRVGDLLRLGLLRATESRHSHLLLLEPDFPVPAETLRDFLSRAMQPGAGPVHYGVPVRAPGAGTHESPRARLARGALSRIAGLELPLWYAPLRLLQIDALRGVPFLYNSASLNFDLDLAIQFASTGKGVETSRLSCPEAARWPPRLKFASLLRSAVQYRLMQFELFFDPKFDLAPSRYLIKEARTSIHHFLRNIPLPPGSSMLDVGGGTGEATGLAHARRGIHVTSIDQVAPPSPGPIRFYRVDLDQPWRTQFPARDFDSIFALDVLEHLKTPEKGLQEIFRLLRRQGTLYASTGNVAFFPLRLMLLLGQFNYGRRGILDLTHRRLFTIGSFRRVLRNSGFSVERIHAFGPPILDFAHRPGPFARILDKIFARLAHWWPGLFAFQFVAVCKRIDSPTELLPEMSSDEGSQPPHRD